MSENLRDKIDRAVNDFIRIWVAPNLQAHLLDDDDNDGERFRQRLTNLLGPELDRLRAEVTGWKDTYARDRALWSEGFEHDQTEIRRLRAEVERSGESECTARAKAKHYKAERDGLRAALAKVDAVRSEMLGLQASGASLVSRRWVIYRLDAALASVPEPSDSELAPDGVARIAAERRRQIDQEGYTSAHDAEHRTADLVAAARAYTWSAVGGFHWARQEWPWGQDSFKPGVSGGARRDLVKAGALIAAAIDRLSEPAPDADREAGER